MQNIAAAWQKEEEHMQTSVKGSDELQRTRLV
jgi:hypothetical protein